MGLRRQRGAVCGAEAAGGFLIANFSLCTAHLFFFSWIDDNLTERVAHGAT